MPPDEDIAEVVDFFVRHGRVSLPLLRRAMDEMVEAKKRGEDGQTEGQTE
jgi:hypothetical protein